MRGRRRDALAATRLRSSTLGSRQKLTATPAEGFQFVGWQRDLEGAEPEAELTVDKHKRVVALFEAIEP